MRIEHPLSVFKIKIIIWMILEPKHKNFKDEYKIKVRVTKNFNVRRHMSILVAFELHYFQELLNWWHSPFKVGPSRKIKFVKKKQLFWIRGLGRSFMDGKKTAMTNLVPKRWKTFLPICMRTRFTNVPVNFPLLVYTVYTLCIHAHELVFAPVWPLI